MRLASVFLSDVFLTIFAATASLNVRQWFGSDRKHANYTNGTIAVSAVQAFFIFDAFRIITILNDSSYYPTKIFLMCIYAVLVGLNYYYIVIHRKGEEFIRGRSKLSRTRRYVLTSSAIIVTVTALVAFFSLANHSVPK